MVTKSLIMKGFKSLDIGPGDVIHMHTALRSLGPVEGGLDILTSAILDVLGDNGLFTVPTHTWQNVGCHQPVFHVRYTPSNLGTFPNYILGRTDALRSVHPSHSVAAIGSRASGFIAGHENDTTPVSPVSPYAKLIDLHAKIVLFGVNLTRNTFFHCLEEIAGCGDLWSLSKDSAKRWTIDHAGKIREIDYRSHANGVSEHYYRCEQDLLEAGIMKQGFVGPAPVKVVDAAASAEWLVPRLKKNPCYFR